MLVDFRSVQHVNLSDRRIKIVNKIEKYQTHSTRSRYKAVSDIYARFVLSDIGACDCT